MAASSIAGLVAPSAIVVGLIYCDVKVSGLMSGLSSGPGPIGLR